MMRREARKLPLRLIPEEAILRLARALARQAARETMSETGLVVDNR
jgi:hypothetical protein